MKTENILHGIPKVYYGAFGGITPFPICLKVVSDYLGDELDYTFALVACGGAFRFAWNTASWDGGNVDIAYTYDEVELPFRYGVTALGREFEMVWRRRSGQDGPTGAIRGKDDFKTFIREHIDRGKPLISLGPVGPPEAGLITGYRDGGETLLGWSLFQGGDGETDAEDGYYVTDAWWGEGEDDGIYGVMALHDIGAPRAGVAMVLRHAIAALEGRREGRHAKGIAAYGPWKKALLNANDEDFALTCGGQHLVMMCQGDATDCLVDGRGHASAYFKRLADAHPEQPLYGEIAAQFGRVAAVIRDNIYGVLGGWLRGAEQIEALEKPEIRRQIGEYIDEMAQADGNALALMKELIKAVP